MPLVLSLEGVMTAIGRCPDCKREWTTFGEAHCASCHEHFGSDYAFDRHRTADFTCVPVEDFGTPRGKAQKPLLVQIERASGVCWVSEVQSPTSPQRRPAEAAS